MITNLFDSKIAAKEMTMKRHGSLFRQRIKREKWQTVTQQNSSLL